MSTSNINVAAQQLRGLAPDHSSLQRKQKRKISEISSSILQRGKSDNNRRQRKCRKLSGPDFQQVQIDLFPSINGAETNTARNAALEALGKSSISFPENFYLFLCQQLFSLNETTAQEALDTFSYLAEEKCIFPTIVFTTLLAKLETGKIEDKTSALDALRAIFENNPGAFPPCILSNVVERLAAITPKTYASNRGVCLLSATCDLLLFCAEKCPNFLFVEPTISRAICALVSPMRSHCQYRQQYGKQKLDMFMSKVPSNMQAHVQTVLKKLTVSSTA